MKDPKLNEFASRLRTLSFEIGLHNTRASTSTDIDLDAISEACLLLADDLEGEEYDEEEDFEPEDEEDFDIA